MKAILLLLGLLVASGASAALLNPSFEIPALGNGYQYNPTAAGIGWTFSANSGIQGNGSAWGAAPAPNSIQTAFIQGTGTISQTLSLNAGSYAMAFRAAQRSSCCVSPYVQPIKVTVDGAQIGGLASPASGNFSSFSIPFSVAAGGQHTLAFAGTDPSDKTTFIDAVTVTASGSSTSTSLVSSLNPSTFGTAVTFTATVTGSSPTGTISFTDNGGTLCSAVPLSASQARCVTSALSIGTHSIVATYGGDAVNAGSVSPILSQTVNSGSGVNGVVSGPGSTGNTATGPAGTAGGTNSIASGGGGPVAFGMAATADGDSGVALGHQAQASGTDSVAIGRTTRAFRDNSVSIGWGNISDSGQGWALGNRSTTRGINKAIVFGATHSDTDNGTEQFGLYSPRVTTTNATPTALTMDGVAPSLSNQNILVLADHSTYGFLARVVARDLATGESATWEIEGVAKKAAGAASVTQTSAVSPVTSDVGPAWSVAMVADTANGGIAVVVTGQAGRTIKWLAKIETVESVGGAN